MKKKLWTGIGAFCVAAGIGAAGLKTSLAYYTDHASVTNEVSFVGENGIAGILTEPRWKPENGILVLPNQKIAKDPQVTNTSEADLPILTALEVQFLYGPECPDTDRRGEPLSREDMKCVYEACVIDWNSDDPGKGDWIRYAGQSAGDQTQCFYYRDTLQRNLPAGGDTTVPLFTSVSVPESVNNKGFSRIQEMQGFDIKIRGAVVQQMTGDKEFGLNSAKDAYEAGIFVFCD